MAEYIEREAALNCVYELIEARLAWTSDARGEIQGINAAVCAIEGTPAADVVEVVRCKDCKHYYAYPDEYRTCHEHYEIDGSTKMMAAGNFCSKGERREVQYDN